MDQQLNPLRRRPEAQAAQEAYAIACHASSHAQAIYEIIRRGLEDNAADADALIMEGGG